MKTLKSIFTISFILGSLTIASAQFGGNGMNTTGANGQICNGGQSFLGGSGGGTGGNYGGGGGGGSSGAGGVVVVEF
jgi:hypothetical protein